MQGRNTLLVGVLASLVLGAAISSLSNTIGARSERIDDSPMRIPAGRIGDNVSYASFHREGPDQSWTPVRDWSFRLDRQADSLDALGGKHATIVIETSPETNAWTRDGALPSKETQLARAAIHVTIARRDIIATVLGQEVTTQTLLAEGKNVRSMTTFGPGAGRPSGEGNYAGDILDFSRFLFVIYQNQSFQLAQPLPVSIHFAPLFQMHHWAFEGALILREYEYRTAVKDRRLIDGHDAYLVRSEGCFRANHAPGSWTIDDSSLADGIPLFHTKVPYDKRVCFEYDAWVTADLPYPVLIEERVQVSGRAHHEWAEVLGDYLPGRDSITWGDPNDPISKHYTQVQKPERSGASIRYPADGTGSSLTFKLHEAIAAVNTPLLARFTLWKTNNPGAQLVGYHATPLEGNGLRWELVYGVKTGKMFVVTADRAGSGPASVHENGEFEYQPFDLAEFHADQLTIAAVEKIWREQTKATEPANHIRWGYTLRNRPGVYCGTPPQCAPSSPAKVEDFNPFGMLLGHQRLGAVAGPVDARAVDRGLVSYVMVATPWATLWSSAVIEHHERFVPLAATNAQPPPPAPATSNGVEPPAVSGTVFASASLFLLLLTLYFLPVLKFLGVDAFQGVFGYAKLKRSELLDNKIREDLTTLIQREPGITPPELQKAVGAGWSTIVYHLRVLEKNGLVTSLLDARHKRYFSAGAVHAHSRAALGALRHSRSRAIYNILAVTPGLGRDEVAHRLGVSRPATYRHLGRLERAGLVTRDWAGPKRVFFVRRTEPKPLVPTGAEVT